MYCKFFNDGESKCSSGFYTDDYCLFNATEEKLYFCWDITGSELRSLSGDLSFFRLCNGVILESSPIPSIPKNSKLTQYSIPKISFPKVRPCMILIGIKSLCNMFPVGLLIWARILASSWGDEKITILFYVLLKRQ